MIFQLLLAALPLGAALAPPPAAAVPCVAAIISVAGDPEANFLIGCASINIKLQRNEKA